MKVKSWMGSFSFIMEDGTECNKFFSFSKNNQIQDFIEYLEKADKTFIMVQDKPIDDGDG